MRVEILNFRCFTKVTSFSFEQGKLTLLKGQSGAGKSTVFEAIRWCLFGSLRNIYPSGFTPTPNNKTYVSVDIMGLRIVRSQAPEQITVYHPQQTITMETAQKYIDSIFGNKDIWLASSFIHQNERCPLITASNAERMSLLNEILFGNDITTPYENPDFYTDKIEEELEIISKDVTGKTAIFNNHYQKYVAVVNNFENSYGWAEMTEEIKNSYKTQYLNLKSKIDEKTKELIYISNLENQKSFLEEKISSFSDVIEIKQEQIDFNVNELTQLQSSINKNISDKIVYSNLQNELENLNSKLNREYLQYNPITLEAEINTLKTEIRNLELQYLDTQNKEIKKQTLEYQLNSLDTDLLSNKDKISKYNITDVAQLKAILDNTIIYTNLKEYQTKLAELKLTEVFKEEDINSLELKYQNDLINLKYTLSICQKYNMNIQDIDEKIKTSSEAIEFNTLQKKHLQNYNLYTLKSNELIKLKSSLVTNFDTYIDLIPSENINEYSVKNLIDTITTRLGSPLKCPCCDATLEYNNGKLEIPKSEIIDRNEGLNKISRLKDLLNILSRNNMVSTMISSLENEIKLIESFDLDIVNKPMETDSQIKIHSSLITECSRVQKSFEIEDVNILESKAVNLKSCREYYKLMKEFNSLQSSFNPSIGVNENVNELRNNIATIPIILSNIETLNNNLSKITNEIMSIVIIESSESIKGKITSKKEELKIKDDIYQQAIDANKISNTILEIQSKMISIDIMNITDENIKSLENKKISLENIIIDMKHMMSKYNDYAKIKEQLKGINLVTSSNIIKLEIDNCKQQAEEYNSMYEKASQLIDILKSAKDIEEIRDTIIKLTTKQSTLNTLKMIIVETSNAALQNLVDNINNMANNVLEELFDSDIIVELKLYKEMKTGKQKIKPQVNLSIYLNGNTLDINSLSGGEKDRVSLAFTLALSMISTSPILLLDECMSALDADLRIVGIDVIKEFLIERSSKYVINIEHNFIEGLFDDIISVEH